MNKVVLIILLIIVYFVLGLFFSGLCLIVINNLFNLEIEINLINALYMWCIHMFFSNDCYFKKSSK